MAPAKTILLADGSAQYAGARCTNHCRYLSVHCYHTVAPCGRELPQCYPKGGPQIRVRSQTVFYRSTTRYTVKTGIKSERTHLETLTASRHWWNNGVCGLKGSIMMNWKKKKKVLHMVRLSCAVLKDSGERKFYLKQSIIKFVWEKWFEVRIYMNSWAMANGSANWSGACKEQ